MQKNYWGLTKYHRFVLCGYAVLVILLIMLAPERMVFSFSWPDFRLFLIICAVLLALAAGANSLLHLVTPVKRRLPLWALLIIAFLFAFPEEILFRGIIQSVLTQTFSSIPLVVALSALIFGLAHLPNRATGLHPSKWNWFFALVSFLAGIPLALLFALTHSLLFPVLLHFLFLVISQQFSQLNKLTREPA